LDSITEKQLKPPAATKTLPADFAQGFPAAHFQTPTLLFLESSIHSPHSSYPIWLTGHIMMCVFAAAVYDSRKKESYHLRLAIRYFEQRLVHVNKLPAVQLSEQDPPRPI
jgi:hypothetical protein